MKARLKEKTGEKIRMEEKLYEYTKIARIIVKMDLPQESWVEFGITAKH
jgi:hypothetical protein